MLIKTMKASLTEWAAVTRPPVRLAASDATVAPPFFGLVTMAALLRRRGGPCDTHSPICFLSYGRSESLRDKAACPFLEFHTQIPREKAT